MYILYIYLYIFFFIVIAYLTFFKK